MTEPASCGRQIHMTAHALRAVRNTALEEHGITFELWTVMEALAEAPDRNRGQLIGRLAKLAVHDSASAADAIDQLHRRDLVTTNDSHGTIELTSQGMALSEQVVATRQRLRHKLYGDIPSEDVATTNRVLDLIRERADALHSSAELLHGPDGRPTA
jgi:DNA-binding MarR family transcriptional regulator